MAVGTGSHTPLENSPALWLRHFPWPKSEGNKYDRGHAIILGGELRSTGAAKLAARGALRSGAGLVSVACDPATLPIYAESFAAIMTKPFANAAEFATLIGDRHVTAVLLGPGAGVTAHTRALVLATLAACKNTVLDADALTVFQDHPPALFDAIHGSCLLTPHDGEFARLFGEVGNDRAAAALAAAKTSGAVIILKGHHTIIAAADGRAVINPGAPATLATAGSGDVLAGIATGLLAQGMPLFEAACAAVWLHTQAALHHGAGLIAEDLPEALPAILSGLAQLPTR